jgi:hypothetical protein
LRFLFAFSGSTLVTITTPFLVKWLGWQLTMAF